MTRKKTGVLIGSVLGFLSQIKAVFAQYGIMESMGEYLNPIARWLVKDSLDFVDQDALWLYVLSYIVVVSILLYAGLRRNKLFANQEGLAKKLAFFLTIMLITAGSSSVIGIFGLAEGVMPVIIMFLVVGLLGKLMPAGGGRASIAGGIGGGRGWFSRSGTIAGGYGSKPGWFSRGVSTMARGYREIRSAQKRGKITTQKTTEDITIEGLIGRADAMVGQISRTEKSLDQEALGLEEYQQRLSGYGERYADDLVYLKNQLVRLRWQNPNDPRIAELENSIRSLGASLEAFTARMKEAIGREKSALQQEVADEEQIKKAAQVEEAEDTKALRDEIIGLKEELKAKKEDETAAKEGAEQQATAQQRERLELAIADKEKFLIMLTERDKKLAAEERQVAEEAEQTEEEAEKLEDERMKYVDEIEQITKDMVGKEYTPGSAVGQTARRDLNIALQKLFPKRNNPVLEKIEHIKKLHEKFEGLERTKKGVNNYKRRVLSQLRGIESEQPAQAA